MAPSPALRFSPVWELSAESSHKRGRSLESGLTLKSKDDDLLLFNEMQNQERDNFLLHTADDFDESLSKLRHFSNFKLGINIPTRGESSDLLNVEGDKSDYDWLLTPPDTPLFSSLDDEYPQPVILAPRSRARSQPIMTSRSVNEKSYQTSRTSSSPHRLSPSPRSSGTLYQMRGRPSSPRSSPPPVIKSATPTRRPSTPPNKQLAPTSRSSTPTLRRASTGSNILSSNHGGRGPSPLKSSHGNSASPKLRGWQMTLPDFTSEAPPNLRTSLPDRPLSHTRGSSPTSRNGSESSGRLGRKSMSPTTSRSISSSHSHERDRFSSYSKCSMVSSSDDYEESLRSMTLGISRSPLARMDPAMGSNKAISFSRKPSRNSSANCIPKRSFDSAVRLRDQHKTPQNMFRPLLSSAPATTFRPIFSRNSSLTTSSNASSEQGVINVAIDMEGSELEPELTELPVGWGKTEDSETHEEVFLFDKVDEIVKDSSHEALSRKPQGCDDFGETLSKKFDSEDIQNPMVHIGVETSCSTLESAHFTDSHCDIDGHTMIAVCSKCCKKFKILDLTEAQKFCQECIDEDNLCTTGITLTCVPLTKIVVSQIDTAVGRSGKGLFNSEVPEFHEGNSKAMLFQHERNIILDADSLSNICPIQLLDQRESELFDQHLEIKVDMNVSGDCGICTPQLSNYAANPNLKVDISEGKGISVLLMQKSGNSKWPILQGKTVSAINILCSEPSYSRDNTNASRRSIGRDSPSASSSVDLGSSRQTETSIQHQLFREGKEDNMSNDIDSSAQSMSLPDLSINCYDSRHLKSECEETSSSSTNCLGYDSLRVITEEHSNTLDQSNFNAIPSSSSRPVISEYYISEHTDTYRTTSSVESQQILDHQGNNDLPCSSAAEVMCSEECASSIHEISVQSVEGRTDISGCSEMEDDYTMLNCTFQNDNFDEASKSSSILSIELQHGYSELDYQTESIPSHYPDYTEQSIGHSISQTSACDISFSTSEPIAAVQEHGNHDESCITVECSGGRVSRSLTLEEATDTILFCSSIIHDLAYQAAMNGMEKEFNLRPEAQTSAPTPTFLGKPIPGLRESVKMPHKPTPSSQKFRRKRIESHTKSPAKELEKYAVKADDAFAAPDVEIPRKVDTIKPPKLESKCNCTVM